MTDKINIDLSKEQTKAFDNLTENNGVHRVLYGGQAGGGKSFLISLWLIYMANQYPETRYYMARRVLKDLRDSILLTFFDVAKLCHVKFRYHDQTKITFPNGSTIHLLECENVPSDPNFDRLGSKEYTAGAIEEGIDVERRAADVLMSRTRYKHDVYGLERKQLITCNPGDSWVKTDIVEPYYEGTLKPSIVFIPATLASNPNEVFAKTYKENLEDMPAFERARLLHGDWNARPKTGGEFWKDFNEDHHVKELEYNPALPLHLSFDENVNPYMTCLVWQVFPYVKHGVDIKQIRQIDEICLPDPRNRVKHVCREFSKRYQGHYSGLLIYGDATSQKEDTKKEKGENMYTDILAHLKSYNPQKKVPTANPAVVTSRQFIDFIYERQTEKKLYQDIEIYINSKCRMSIDDYKYTLEDSDGTVKKVKIKNPDTGVTYEKWGHISDAKRYFLTRLLRDEYNKYRRGGKNPSYLVGEGSRFARA